MSFFEQMMKLTLPKKNPASRPSTPSQQLESTEPRQTQHPAFTPRDPNSSRSPHQENEGWEDVADEPPIVRIKIGPKPLLLHNVLSRKEQMMRQMLQKKRQFQLKKRNLCREKHEVELVSKLTLESQKFMESRLSSVKSSKGNQQRQQKGNTSSGKLFSDHKSKPLLNLSQSVCSATLQTQALSSPVADQFSKEIMLKLLNIIQQDRSRAPLQQPVEQSKLQKESPIIINNIMKTPMETVTRDIIEREMKIRMLENTRSQRQYDKHSNLQKQQCCHPCREFTEEQFVLTDRTNLGPSNQGFEMVSSSCKKQASSAKQVPSGSKEQKQKENCVPQQSLKRSFSKQITGEIKVNIEQSTKNNSSQNSRVQEFNESSVPPDHRKREFKQPPVRPIQNIAKETIEPQQKIKAPVKLQIPLEDQTTLEGLTLAEAFKRRVGRLKSEQKRSEKLHLKSEKKLSQALEAFPSQMTISITEKMTEYHSELDFSAPTSAKIIGIATEGPLSKRTNNTRPRSKVSSVRQTSSKKIEGPSKKMSEPSKELMDRLIYGQKAKMSKEEMYALTKKNYNNLPEVQAKRREEEKRMMEQERQNKAREYQKAIRSKRSQLKT